MPKIKLSENHGLAREELIKRVDDYLSLLRDDKMKAMNFGFEWNSAQTDIALTGSGFKGSVKLSDSSVDVLIDLSMMLTPFKGKVEESLKRGLKKYLG